MASASITDKVSYQEFREEWIAEVEDGEPSPLDKGRRFASNLITQWLDVTTDDDDFVICDGSGDGGIDVAYLKRADIDTERHDDNSEEGDTWYLVQSKYGTAFAGVDTILEEGSKVIATLTGPKPAFVASQPPTATKTGLVPTASIRGRPHCAGFRNYKPDYPTGPTSS